MAIDGVSDVLRHLKKALIGKKKAAKQVLILTGTEVRRRGSELTPVDTGNLINSWYGPVVISDIKSDEIIVEIGLQAAYAPCVHEMMETTFKKPEASAKFLEIPVKEVADELPKDMQAKMKEEK
jgi:hypothetical protein